MRPFSMQSKQHIRMSVPNNNNWPTLKKLQQNIIKFPYSAYPFPNHAINADLFNTLVQCNINQHKINKIVNLKCQNIINLKKIVKIKMKDKKQNQQQNSQRSKQSTSTYSFYYQKVQFSLGYILQNKNKQHVSKHNKFNIDRAQIKKTIASVIATLYKQGIIIFLQFSHIGINQNGIIKIYIAPNVLFDQRQYNPKTKILVITYLNNVLKIIDNKFPKTLKTKNSIQSFKSKPQLSIQKDIIQSQQSFIIDQPNDMILKNQQILKNKRKEFFQDNQKSYNQEEENFIGASGSTNLQHLKLQKQMKNKFQNHKLASKVQQNINSQKKSKILSKVQQKQKICQLTLQLEHMRKKIRQKAQQKRQQNIYASKAFKTMDTHDNTLTKQNQKRQENILQHLQNYNQNNKPSFQRTQKVQNLTKKRKSSQSSINFYQGKVPQQTNINCINIYNPKNYQKSFYHLGEDAMSIDTYQLQIGDDYQMPKITPPLAMRNSLAPQKNRQSFKFTPKIQYNGKQQIKSRFSQSAGAKSFGHIVNLLKPQFQPKKSNIYEQPQFQNQQESKKSNSPQKSIGKQASDKSYSIQKYQISPNIKELSSSANISGEIKGLKTVQQFKNDLKNLMSFRMDRQSPRSPQVSKNQPIQKRLTLPISKSVQRNPQTQIFNLRRTQHRPQQKSPKRSDILIKKSDLQQKVKQAMQRTKKAINVLNTAKIRQSGSVNWLKNVQLD